MADDWLDHASSPEDLEHEFWPEEAAPNPLAAETTLQRSCLSFFGNDKIGLLCFNCM